jgi:hypothetical protein
MSEFAPSSGFAGRGARMLRIAEPLRRLVRDLSDHYRPELHYMRGPGPKWREKHAKQQVRGGPTRLLGSRKWPEKSGLPKRG